MRQGLSLLAASLFWVLLSFAALAQDATSTIDYDAWSNVAERAEAAIDAGKASNEAFESLRSEVVVWRERFLRGQDVNAARIATIRSQIEALGAPPGEGEAEAPEIAARRVELADTLATARAPIVKAEGAYRRADGLAREIDQIIRDRQADRLLSLGPTPLNPANWPGAWVELNRSVRVVVTETVTAWQSEIRRESLQDSLPQVLLFLVVSFVLLLRSGRIVAALRSAINEQLPRRVLRTAEIIWSLLEFLLPVAGLFLAASALSATGLIGIRGGALLEAIPVFAFTSMARSG